MTNVRPGTERDLAWQWARAEIDSTRFAGAYACRLSGPLMSLIREGRRDAATETDWTNITEAVYAVRFPLLADLRRLRTCWYIGELDFDEVPAVRIMNWPPLVALSPDRTLAALAAALDRGHVPPDDPAFAENYRRLRSAFAIGNLRGDPVIVAESREGPYIVVEGYSRLSVLTSKHLSGDLAAGSIRVVLGVCDNLREWRLYDSGTGLRTPHRLF